MPLEDRPRPGELVRKLVGRHAERPRCVGEDATGGLVLREAVPLVRRADDRLEALRERRARGRLVREEPVGGAAREREVRHREHAALERQMHAENRREGELLEVGEALVGGAQRGRAEPRETVGRHCGDHALRAHEALVADHARHALAVERQRLGARAEAERTTRRRDDLLDAVIEPPQRHARHAHGAGKAMDEHAFVENLERVRGLAAGARQVARGDHHGIPEQLDDARGLLGFREKLAERAARPSHAPLRPHAQDREERPRDRPLLREGEELHAGEARRVVERRGKDGRDREPVERAAAARKPERLVPLDLVEHAEPVVELEHVRAAAHHHMLAVVELDAAAHIVEARGAAAELDARLEELDPPARVDRRDGGCDSRDATANDRDGALDALLNSFGHAHRASPEESAPNRARSAIHDFVSVESRARSRMAFAGSRAITPRMPR